MATFVGCHNGCDIRDTANNLSVNAHPHHCSRSNVTPDCTNGFDHFPLIFGRSLELITAMVFPKAMTPLTSPSMPCECNRA